VVFTLASGTEKGDATDYASSFASLLGPSREGEAPAQAFGGGFHPRRVTDMTLPPSATLGQQIQLSYDVTNEGGAEPFNRWND